MFHERFLDCDFTGTDYSAYAAQDRTIIKSTWKPTSDLVSLTGMSLDASVAREPNFIGVFERLSVISKLTTALSIH